MDMREQKFGIEIEMTGIKTAYCGGHGSLFFLCSQL